MDDGLHERPAQPWRSLPGYVAVPEMVTRLASSGDQPGKGCQVLGGAEALYVTYLRDYGEGEYRPDTGDGRRQLLRRFALPREVSHWSLSSIQLKLIRIGAKVD